MGESDFDIYQGRIEPALFQDPYLGNDKFIDEIVEKTYPYQSIEYSLFPLEDFFKKEFTAGALCPNEQLSEHLAFIHYAYRLINLSYLAEALMHYAEVSQKIESLKNCHIDLEELLKSCRPQNSQMKNFIKKASFQARQIKDEQWVKVSEFRDPNQISKESYQKNYLYGKRILALCQEKECHQSFQDNMNQVCSLDKELFLSICSEQDHFWGMSWVSYPYHLLSESHITENFSDSKTGQGCMRRFSEIFKDKENKNSQLSHLYPLVQEHVKEKFGERFIQGRLFLAGSLKKYDEQGLKDIFFSNTEKKEESKPKVENKVAQQVPEIKKTVMPQKKKAELKVPAEALPPPKKVVKRKSAFEESVENLEKLDLEKAQVDMIRFKYDFVFTQKLIESLKTPLQKFMKQNSIREMKKFDQLGTVKGPVPLLFVKYMIDTNNHQGLYNLILVLGNKFYVKNNLEGKENLVRQVELSNNSETNYKWQITVVK